MNKSDEINLIRIIAGMTTNIIDDDKPESRALIEAATIAHGPDVPAYMATFKYLHDQITEILNKRS